MNWFCVGLLTGGTNRKNSFPSLVLPKTESGAMWINDNSM